LAMLGADLDAVGGDELHIPDADETEHSTQIGLEVLERGHRRVGAVIAAARDRDDDALVAGQPLDAGRAVFEGLACDEDAVDPGLELRGDREVVHRRTDHHDVGGEELVEHRLAGRDVVAHRRIRRRALAGRKVQAGEVGERGLAEVAVAHDEAGIGLAQPLDGGGGDLAADGMRAEDGGIDVQKFHGRGHLWY
ncbi:hypothetical protein chiPu_0030467, partial [Chiloscyllium punctatum]|nr:hypothetical protein [Chiloscyllium punctatum]